MLKECPYTYTEILNELGIENGLLNYHLENLSDLLGKGEDEKYRLSEFGEAGLSVIERVETPKSSFEPKRYLSLSSVPSIVIILLLFVSALLNGFYYVNTLNLEKKVDELSTVEDKLASMSESVEEFRAEAVGGPIVIVSSYGLSVVRENDDRFAINGLTGALFYVPEDGSVIEVSLSIRVPGEGLRVPLVVQEGNAYRNSSATICSEKNGAEICHAPVFWAMNVTESGTYEVNLTHGWYTLSISGVIDYLPGSYNHHLLGSELVNGTWSTVPVDLSATFRVRSQEAHNMFAVNKWYVRG
jgi:hypothetical protein